MKKLFLISLLALLTIDSDAQRRRTIEFDADVATPANPGRYGVGVINNQPYLINSQGSKLRIEVDNVVTPVWSSGNSTYLSHFDLAQDFLPQYYEPDLSQGQRFIEHTFVILKDSVTLDLIQPFDPSVDSVPLDGDGNAIVSVQILYLGGRGGNGNDKWEPYDSTSYLNVVSPVYYRDTSGVYSSTYFSHNHPLRAFYIELNHAVKLIWRRPSEYNGTEFGDGAWFLSTSQ